MFRSALICTDFSDSLQRLAHFIAPLAASGLEHIVFFYNAPLLKEREIPRVDEEQVQVVRDRLNVALEQVPPGVTVKIEIQPGRVVDNILRLAREYQADVIFLGMSNQSLLSEKLFGSTTMGLAQRCITPIITLRPHLIATYTTEELALRCQHLFRFLLLPYDGSQTAHKLVQRVKHYYQTHPAPTLERCLLYWVMSDSGRRELRGQAQIDAAQAELATVQAELTAVGLTVDIQVKTGAPIAEILTAAMDNDITAIAIASDTLGKLREWSVSSFTGELLRQSWHPVLYFPPLQE